MKNRGLMDILIACIDNLTGMSEAISAVLFKMRASTLYRVHQIRNSLKFVSYKDRKKLAADLKPIYQAITEEALESFEAKWGKNYPQIAKSWYNNWDNLMIFFTIS
jgi:putative transposase